MEKTSDPGSGINIPDQQHFLKFLTQKRQTGSVVLNLSLTLDLWWAGGWLSLPCAERPTSFQSVRTGDPSGFEPTPRTASSIRQEEEKEDKEDIKRFFKYLSYFCFKFSAFMNIIVLTGHRLTCSKGQWKVPTRLVLVPTGVPINMLLYHNKCCTEGVPIAYGFH